MSLYDIIVARRTIRQFKADAVPRPLLEKIINSGRLAPSAGNLQPLEFVVVDDEEIRERIFPCLRWAGYIAPEGNPKPGREPTAYVIPIVNLEIREKGYEYDVGAAVENMILTAAEEGVGACWLISVDREKVTQILGIPEACRIACVLALGYPAESPVLEDFRDSAKYWKDEDGILHVPKRLLKNVIHFNKFP